METAHEELTPETHSATVCPNCGKEFHDDFCAHCGEQKHHAEELTLKHFLLHATHDLTHLDAKIFATLRYLFTRPGFLTQEFLAGRRTRYMRPFSLFLLACAIFFLADSIKPISGYDVHQLTTIDRSGQVDAAWEKLALAKHLPKELIMERIQDTLHRAATGAQLFNALVLAITLAVLFHRRSFVEHLVVALHVLAFTYLAGVLLSPLNASAGLLHARGLVSMLLVTLIFGAYLFITLRRIYGQGVVATFFKTVVAYAVIQMVTLVTLIMVLVLAVVRAARA